MITKIKKICIFNWKIENYGHFRHPNKNMHSIYLFILTNGNTTLRCYRCYLCYRVPHYNVYFLFFPEAGQGSSWTEGAAQPREAQMWWNQKRLPP